MDSDEIDRHREFLEEYIEPDYGLLDKLQTTKSLTIEEIHEIKGCTSYQERNSKLLECISNKGAHEGLTRALKETQQAHVVNHVYTNGGDIVESSWSEVLLRHREFLIKNVEPDFGLVYKLNAIEVLSDEDKAEISAENTVYKRNSKLLERIRTKKEYDAFVEALKSTNQQHVVNYLERNGIYPSDDDWPLLARERSILRANQETLNDLLDVQDLMYRLYSVGVINLRQKDFISTKQTSYQRSEALLDILSRRSIKDYKKTIKCLRDSKQSHIAQILEEGGVVVRVHAELPDDKTEDEIISGIMSLLYNKSSEDSRRILGTVDNLIAVKKGESIVLYIYCRTIDKLVNLQELQVSGRLVTILQRLFVDVLLYIQRTGVTAGNIPDAVKFVITEILQRCEIEEIKVTVSEEEYNNGKMYSDEVTSAFDDEWPLTEKQISILDINCETLTDLLDASELIVKLLSKGVINNRQYEYISSLSTPYEKNDAWLNIQRKKSLKDYKRTIQCLRETDQSNIANILEEGGVSIKLHAEYTGAHAKKTADEIFAHLKRKSPGELNFIQKLEVKSGLHVIAITRSHCIILHIYFKTLEEVFRYKELRMSGRFRAILESLFHEVLFPLQYDTSGDGLMPYNKYRSRKCPQFKVTLSDEEYNECLWYKYFPDAIEFRAKCNYNSTSPWDDMFMSFGKGDHMKAIAKPSIIGDVHYLKAINLGNKRMGYIPKESVEDMSSSSDALSSDDVAEKCGSQHPKVSLGDLPIELLDVILQKCHVLYTKGDIHSHRLRHKYIFRLLASINYRWCGTILKRSYKRRMMPRLKLIYREARKLYGVYRHNLQFLEETTESKSLIQKLKLADCITDIQTHMINRRRQGSRKRSQIFKGNTSDLFSLVRSFDKMRHSAFIRCLHNSNQNDIARIICNGGALAKSQIGLRQTHYTGTENWVKQLAERLAESQDKSALRPHELDLKIAKMKEDGIEITSCSLEKNDREAVIWFRSQSADDLLKLQELNESGNLGKAIADLTRISKQSKHTCGVFKPNINLDGDQFKKDALVFSICATFVGNINTEADKGSGQHREFSRQVWRSQFDSDISQEFVSTPSTPNKTLKLKAHFSPMRLKQQEFVVTKLRNKIYVINRVFGNSILVFDDQSPFRRQKEVKINECLYLYPTNLVSSERANCLYVMDNTEKCIWKLKDEGNSSFKATKWLFIEVGYMSIRSISTEGHLLVITWLGNFQDEILTLKIYGHDAKLQHYAPLPREIKYLWHAVETSRGNFVVAYALPISEGKGLEQKAAVSEISRDCQMIIRRFLSRDKIHDIYQHLYLSIDSNDRLFIVDNHKYRVMILDPTYKWMQILHQKYRGYGGKGGRWNLFYDEIDKQLIIVREDVIHEIGVYNLSNTVSRFPAPI